jgi:HD superfamily phosphohydrolase
LVAARSNRLKYSSSLRDPVYGIVPVTSIEQEILKLPLLNRLKNIKQLGLAYLAFPGANHTRFEHSVGTMHVASLMSTAIEITEAEMETVRIAALLHDVGHPPFSHSIEFACNLFGIKEIPDHKTVTRKRIIDDKALCSILKERRPLIHIEDVADLAVGRFKTPYLCQIIDGAIDADKIDYILRDNHHCGFPVALDINTISEILSKDAEHGLTIRPEGQSFAEQLFIGRYHLVSKIHHNLKNRLGNYLLALTLRKAWNSVKDKMTVATYMTEEWTDGDLMAFLQKEAADEFGVLRNHLLGNEVFHEICNFDFQNLSPLDRYSAAIISSNPSYLPKMSDAFSKWFKDKQFFIDAYIASPPEPSLTIGTDPPRLLVDTPLSKAALEASLKEIHVAVYSREDVAEGDLDMSKLLERYSKELDNTFDEKKAKGLMEMWWNNDKKEFCVHKITELILNSETMDLRNHQDFTSDLILVTAIAIYQSFAEVFKRIVFIQSLSEIVKILHDLKQENFFKKCDSSDMKIYDIVQREDRSGYLLPPQFLVDIEMLETFGLMYRITKVAKFGEHFQQKYQMRISGWGRAYFQRNMSNVQDLLSLSSRLKEHFTKIIKDHENKYAELFEKVTEEPTSREVAQEAKKLTKDLPLKVI